MPPIKRALVSVSDKTGVVEFARELHEMGVEILSTGGTARILKEAGVPVILVSDYTGFPEIMDGRVKTLNPKIHGGILGVRDNPDHQSAMKKHKIQPIDLVAINLYPFESTIGRPEVTLEEAIENIDIGGPAMLRSAAKNYKFVTVIVHPSDFPLVLRDMEENRGETSLAIRHRLARDAFRHTSRYDGLIQDFLTDHLPEDEEAEDFPEQLCLFFEKIKFLRYGENPHQKAAFYKQCYGREPGIASAEKLQGKGLSYNNIQDLQAAHDLVEEFQEPTAVVVKHTNPCGVASDPNLLRAFIRAREVDPLSAFGSILAFNRPMDAETAEEIIKNFVEAVIAPEFASEALEIFARKKNLRLLKLPLLEKGTGGRWVVKDIGNGVLLQEKDDMDLLEDKLKVVTTRQPSPDEWKSMRFAWKVAKHVKSNAIVYASGLETVGIGAGQMSRVDSAKIAISKARRPLKGMAMASDAFFPFRDAVDVAADQGITTIIQPGGSVRDQEIIDAANGHKMSMVFTGVRHFRH